LYQNDIYIRKTTEPTEVCSAVFIRYLSSYYSKRDIQSHTRLVNTTDEGSARYTHIHIYVDNVMRYKISH
jgi:hypothetical protein